ncbi:MAG: carbohydrate kinase [Clostridiales bacterium]|nr:carbohydrate kinase [Clostridiales bacterium]
MFDIVALGELLIDFTPRGVSEQGSYVFEANSGGAPCNVLAAARRLDKSAAFIGKVGTDMFGRFLKETIEKLGIDSSGLILSEEFFTTLAFVKLDEQGNREFSFSRNNSADVMLTPEEVDPALIRQARIFHCGTLSLTHPASRAALRKGLDLAKEYGVLISVDPNLREPLWENLEAAKAAMRLVLSCADIIKISDYELAFLYGETDVVKAARRLLEDFRPKILFATCGKEGAYLLKDGILLHQPCFEVKTIDTTGAGDAFCGAALSRLADRGLAFDRLDEAACRELLRYASAAASLATAKRGAIPAMPAAGEIDRLLQGA